MSLPFSSVWADGPCRKIIIGGFVVLVLWLLSSGFLLATQKEWWIAPLLVSVVIILVFWDQLRHRMWDLSHRKGSVQ